MDNMPRDHSSSPNQDHPINLIIQCLENTLGEQISSVRDNHSLPREPNPPAVSSDRKLYFENPSIFKDKLYYDKLTNFIQFVWSDRCKRLDDLWQTLNREDSQISDCARYVEGSVFGIFGERNAILPELQNNFDKIKILSEAWFARKSNIFSEIDKFKSETLMTCENFRRYVKRLKSYAEQLPTASNLEHNQNSIKALASSSSCTGDVVFGVAEFPELYDLQYADEEHTIIVEPNIAYLQNPDDETVRCSQVAEDSLNALINTCVPSSSPSHEASNSGYQITVLHDPKAKKRKRSNEQVTAESYCCTKEENLDQVRRIFLTHFDKLSADMCKKMDIYFDEMHVYNNACIKILNECIQTIWPGETYSSVSQKLS